MPHQARVSAVARAVAPLKDRSRRERSDAFVAAVNG